jgi:GTPase SAR1 family protein
LSTTLPKEDPTKIYQSKKIDLLLNFLSHNFISWLNEVRDNATGDEMSIFIVGNKKDLIDLREVTTEEAGAFAAQNKLFFLETSALDNSDRMIEKVFMTLS